ncbi:MAG: hypothetical protein SF187_03985 [Deltaproteobacteria bacterium]|nr:hypothetical protein [Deltaproteobacteria bacterium]
MRLWLPFTIMLLACGGPTSMGGFAEREATATLVSQEPTDVCAQHEGNLVVEVRRVQINEYPHHHDDGRKQQPLLVRSFEHSSVKPRSGDVEAWVSPNKYASGATVDVFDGIAVVNQPLRNLRGWQLVIRLAENDRTGIPRWAKVATKSSGASTGVALAGVPAPPSSLIKDAIEQLRKIDNDDLIFVWRVNVADVEAALKEHTGGWPAHIYKLATTRRSKGGPAATLELMAYVQPELGCGRGAVKRD